LFISVITSFDYIPLYFKVRDFGVKVNSKTRFTGWQTVAWKSQNRNTVAKKTAVHIPCFLSILQGHIHRDEVQGGKMQAGRQAALEVSRILE
jgi:hypothetical protein